MHATMMDEVRGFAVGGFEDDATLVVAAVR